MKTMLLSVAIAGALTMLLAAGSISLAEDTAKKGGPVFGEAKQPEGFPKPGVAGKIVIKEYPVYRAAKVTASDDGRNRMFNKLFNHIKRNEIAMTAPVEMTYGKRGPKSMAFMYANTKTGKIGAEGEVEVVDVAPQKVVSVAVYGSYNRERFEDAREKLTDWLEKNKEWQADGPARFLAFNSPFVPGPLKYGETQIPIRKAGESQ